MECKSMCVFVTGGMRQGGLGGGWVAGSMESIV